MPERGEQEINARLRRVDWRFLLPSPKPRRAFCRASRALADAVASIAGEIVTSGAAGDCDLAVGEDPDASRLAELREALRPGGVCCTQWHLSERDIHRIERALRDAGFVEVACYRPWPAGARLPVYWIPLGAAGATGYVRARGRLRGGRVRRLLARAREWTRAIVGGRHSPVCAIARRPGSASAEAYPAAWVREAWAEWDLGPTPERLSTLLVTGGPRSVSKVVLLAFAEPSPAPVVAIKAPRVDDAAAGVRREGAALASLVAGPAAAAGVPRILFRREIDGVPILGETALAGRPLESLLGPRNLSAWSIKVAEWLAALGKGGAVVPAAHWRERIVEPVHARFVEQFGQVADPALLRESEGLIRAIGDLPRVPEQRDLGPWNVLVTPAGELAVLDWESAEVEGLPALDLLYYLAYASFNVDRAHDTESRVASYRRSLDPSSRTGVVRRECLARYLGALGLGEAAVTPLRVLLWLIHAASEFRHAAADAGGTPPSSVLARSLFLSLWAEDVRRTA